MERWRTSTRLPLLVDALALPEEDAAVRRLVDAFGGDAVAVSERLVGEPAYPSRRLRFSSGGEIVFHDGAVAEVLLHLTPTPGTARGLDLSDWIDAVDNEATLGEVVKAVDAARRFAGIREPYLCLDGGYVRIEFAEKSDWNDPGNLRRIAVTLDRPGLACRPHDDDCPACGDLLVRRNDADEGVDVDATVESLAAALHAGHVTEDAHWVLLADLRPLHSSGLMDRVETQLTCRSCRRIICFTLFRDSSPTFEYHVMNDAMRRPLETIPPVERWADAARVAENRNAMHYIDHEPGAWFLVSDPHGSYLQARYTYSAVIDDSALIRLDDGEVEAYRAGGHEYLSSLAMRIHDSAPYREGSPYFPRNLYRGPDHERYRAAVSSAIVNHTWIAEQRRTK